MSDFFSGGEFFGAIRVHGTLLVVVTARGLDEDAVSEAHEVALSKRPSVERGRFYFGSVDAGLCEAAFNAAVLRAVAGMDLHLDGELAGEYRIAA